MAEISGSIGEFAGALRTMLGLSRRNRTRDHIRELVELYAQLDAHDELKPAAKSVSEAITHQADRLKDVHVSGRRRRANWSSFAIGVVFTLAAAYGVYALRGPDEWWTITLFVILILLTVLFLFTTVASLFEDPGET